MVLLIGTGNGWERSRTRAVGPVVAWIHRGALHRLFVGGLTRLVVGLRRLQGRGVGVGHGFVLLVQRGNR